jgi:hypothetical protein
MGANIEMVLLIILAFWLLEFQTIWSVVQWGALIPEEINLGTIGGGMCVSDPD